MMVARLYVVGIYFSTSSFTFGSASTSCLLWTLQCNTTTSKQYQQHQQQQKRDENRKGKKINWELPNKSAPFQLNRKSNFHTYTHTHRGHIQYWYGYSVSRWVYWMPMITYSVNKLKVKLRLVYWTNKGNTLDFDGFVYKRAHTHIRHIMLASMFDCMCTPIQ